MSLAVEAMWFAWRAHSSIGQVRKYTGEPYFVHPAEVVTLLTTEFRGATQEMIAAAWLHDVVEDTPVSLETIYMRFGPIVGNLVAELTDKSKPEDGNRAARKAIDREHMARASAEGQTIKCCDLIANTSSIAQHDPKFAKLYLQEKAALLEVMTKADPSLRRKAIRQIAHLAVALHCVNDINRSVA